MCLKLHQVIRNLISKINNLTTKFNLKNQEAHQF